MKKYQVWKKTEDKVWDQYTLICDTDHAQEAFKAQILEGLMGSFVTRNCDFKVVES